MYQRTRMRHGYPGTDSQQSAIACDLDNQKMNDFYFPTSVSWLPYGPPQTHEAILNH